MLLKAEEDSVNLIIVALIFIRYDKSARKSLNGNPVDILLKDNGYLRNIVIYMFIANEGISILENWSAMGIKLPAIIKDKFDNMKGGEENEQNK